MACHKWNRKLNVRFGYTHASFTSIMVSLVQPMVLSQLFCKCLGCMFYASSLYLFVLFFLQADEIIDKKGKVYCLVVLKLFPLILCLFCFSNSFSGWKSFYNFWCFFIKLCRQLQSKSHTVPSHVVFNCYHLHLLLSMFNDYFNQKINQNC